jgi:alpha-D-ribose 1-methylphosphonate 5-triphosphate synthase subunit PhnG
MARSCDLQTTLGKNQDTFMTPPPDDIASRQRWLAVLARASAAELEALSSQLDPLPAVQWLRRCETGMVMLRARVGGTGAPFHVGEASVTRCALRLGDGPLGVGYTLGREPRKAELIACFDARLQQTEHRLALLRSVIEPLAQRQAEASAQESRESASSTVAFYTMVRGEA